MPLAEQGDRAADLERLFVTPHGVGIARAAEGLGVASARVTDPSTLRDELARALTSPRATVLEAVVPPRDAGPRRRALGASIDRAVAEALT